MPLRDHFRPPLDLRHSWEELHAGWPMVIVQHLRTRLPAGYIAAPGVHSGSHIEVDIAAFRQDAPISGSPPPEDGGGVTTAVWAPPQPSVAIETTLAEYDEYEVRIYDARRSRHLVATIEIVSPANKDRPEHRNAFVGKCAALIQKGVAVTLVDLVTVRSFNLYAELMTFLGRPDPTLGDDTPDLYGAGCRWVRRGNRTMLEGWSMPLLVGQPLPTMPLWLDADLVVPLDLEGCYEKACSDLWIE
ncbi:MAG: DUF4058 family protein [Gemmataceae bacterium]